MKRNRFYFFFTLFVVCDTHNFIALRHFTSPRSNHARKFFSLFYVYCRLFQGSKLRCNTLFGNGREMLLFNHCGHEATKLRVHCISGVSYSTSNVLFYYFCMPDLCYNFYTLTLVWISCWMWDDRRVDAITVFRKKVAKKPTKGTLWIWNMIEKYLKIL